MKWRQHMHRWAATSHRVGPGRRRRWLRITVLLCAGLLVLGVAGRALLPWFVRDFVNRTLDRGQLYSGHIGKVGIHLWRGAYSIHDVRLSKTTGNVPVPFPLTICVAACDVKISASNFELSAPFRMSASRTEVYGTLNVSKM